MRKWFVACLCAGFIVPAAFAAKDSAMDISHLVKSGEWRSTSVTITNGKADKPETDTSCEHFRDLSDFLNQSASGHSKTHFAYKLDGNHLHVFGPLIMAGKKIGTIDENFFFDSPKAMHGTTQTKISLPSGRTVTSLMKIRGQWIGPCKPGEDDDE